MLAPRRGVTRDWMGLEGIEGEGIAEEVTGLDRRGMDWFFTRTQWRGNVWRGGEGIGLDGIGA
jgi:hypothetical protein